MGDISNWYVIGDTLCATQKKVIYCDFDIKCDIFDTLFLIHKALIKPHTHFERGVI